VDEMDDKKTPGWRPVRTARTFHPVGFEELFLLLRCRLLSGCLLSGFLFCCHGYSPPIGGWRSAWWSESHHCWNLWMVVSSLKHKLPVASSRLQLPELRRVVGRFRAAAECIDSSLLSDAPRQFKKRFWNHRAQIRFSSARSDR